jgi:EamA-like transporter family
MRSRERLAACIVRSTLNQTALNRSVRSRRWRRRVHAPFPAAANRLHGPGQHDERILLIDAEQLVSTLIASWVAVLVLGLFSWGMAMVMWMWVLNHLDVSLVLVSVYLLPIFGVILSAFTLKKS